MKRFLVQYEGPIADFVTTVNGSYVIFHPIKMKGKIDKVGEVFNQNAFNFVLTDSHITPYAPCPEALKQLNKLQDAREKAQAEAEKKDKVSRLKNQIDATTAKVVMKQEEAINLISSAKVIEAEIKDLLDLIPGIKAMIDGILGIKKTAPPKKTVAKKKPSTRKKK